ncbi:hypothetical protein K8R33_03865 [archaeon]|nr:hypothetical protein [archaeon]
MRLRYHVDKQFREVTKLLKEELDQRGLPYSITPVPLFRLYDINDYLIGNDISVNFHNPNEKAKIRVYAKGKRMAHMVASIPGSFTLKGYTPSKTTVRFHTKNLSTERTKQLFSILTGLEGKLNT